MITVIRELIAEGWQITGEDLAVLSPHLTANIQRFGVYATDEVALAPDAYNAHLGVELAAAALLSGWGVRERATSTPNGVGGTRLASVKVTSAGRRGTGRVSIASEHPD
ncbi:hypothetical protein AB0M36_13870 [Actinoplanes sp. NPDC051346]|uniref:hypothetical protein n=1 Tax=Actinoplanes sp. NPDC051346 TaxID=3155048 RepID=UPI003430262B